jgi:DNA invertase Pin-like site-specific DNA recombinase
MRKKNRTVYRTAIYCRLSDEDYVKKREVSESIENQLTICRQYIAHHAELQETAVYMDDGCTGLNYNREGYLQMMEAAGRGEIDCIITKTLARLGREHAETIKLFKHTFVVLQLRYIAVVDHIDFNGRIESMDIPFKVVMNDNYSLETSKNVRSAFRAKAGRGEFIGSFAPYGYQKASDDKSRLEIDPEAAAVVKRIYSEFIGGKNIMGIAHGLNDENLPCPSVYKQMKGYNYNNNRKLEKTCYWTYSTVKRILQDESEVYIGNMVQHRTEKMAYNVEQLLAVPKEEWIHTENTHEAIIDRQDHEVVQRLIRMHWKPMDCSKNLNRFAGMVYCGDCGRSLVRTRRKDGEILRCATYARIGVKYCSQHRIYEQELADIVRGALYEHTADALAAQDFNKLQDMENTPQYDAEAGRLEAKLKNLECSYKKMLMRLSEETINEGDFYIFKEEYTRQKKILETRLAALQSRGESEKIYFDEYQSWMADFFQYRMLGEPTREIIVNLIDKIKVYENTETDERQVEIDFRFRKIMPQES